MSTDRTAALLRKIKALQSKTTAAGATEAEAMAAAERAAHLMAEHQLTDTDLARIQYRRQDIEIKDARLDTKKAHPLSLSAYGLSHVSGCQIYGAERKLVLVGDDVAIEIASYLIDLVHKGSLRAWKIEREKRIAGLERSWKVQSPGEVSPSIRKALQEIGNKNLRKKNAATDKKARYAYMLGYCSRINQRLAQMPPARGVTKDVADAMLNARISEPEIAHLDHIDRASFGAGSRSGDTASLAMGLRSSGGSNRMISGGKP